MMPTSSKSTESDEAATPGDESQPRPDLSGSRLLAGLPEAELAPFRAVAVLVRPRMRESIYEQGGAMEYAYFPSGGVFSMLAAMSNGSVVETLTIGNEGMIGLPALMGASRSPSRIICQVSGKAIRIPIGALLAATPREGVLFDRLVRYAQARLTSLSRSVACNQLHTAQQRCARWILITHDRTGFDEFPITQDFLSQMLGVTRPTISAVGRELQAAGLIHYAKGRLTVDDRAGLERVACECYGIVRDAFDELLGVKRG